MKGEPLVSVLLPFYNAEQTLESAILSVLGQSYRHIELILVNNNSTDLSAEIALSFVKTDSRVRYACEQRQGVVHATNRAFSLAQGLFISRMDADDYAYPHKIEKQFSLLMQFPDVGAVSCLVEYAGDESIDGDGMEHYVSWTNTCVTLDEISLGRFVESPIVNPTILFRREVLDAYGFYRTGDFPEDYELWLRLLHAGVQIVKVPELLFRWHDSPDRLTRTDALYTIDAFYRIKSYYAALFLSRFVSEDRRIKVWGAGRVSRRRFDMLVAEGICADGFIDFNEDVQNSVMDYRELRYSANLYILVYVASRGARETIRQHLLQLRFVEGRDFMCMA